MKKIITYIQVFVLLSIVAFLFVFAQIKNKHHNISAIDVFFLEKEPAFITVETVNKLLIHNESKLLNKAKSTINLHKLEQKLREDKMIENAEVFITPKGELQTQIIQRVPIMRIQEGAKSYYIDRKGERMPLSRNHSSRVPLVTGVSDKKAEKEVIVLVEKIKNDEFLKKQIIGIHRYSNGDYLLSTRIGRHKVMLGKINRLNSKLRKLKIFYKKEWNSETIKKYKLINLKYDRQVVCER